MAANIERHDENRHLKVRRSHERTFEGVIHIQLREKRPVWAIWGCIYTHVRPILFSGWLYHFFSKRIFKQHTLLFDPVSSSVFKIWGRDTTTPFVTIGSPLLRTPGLVYRINNRPMPYTKWKAPMTAIVDFKKATLQKSLSKWLLLGHFVLV